MLSGPFLSNFVLLEHKHPHLTHLRCAKSAERTYHLSVVYGARHGGVVVHDGGVGQAETSLALASGKGYLDTVKFLVRRGVCVHANDDGALIGASRRGHLEVTQFLILHGADVHANNDRALKRASKHNYLDVVQFLVQSGANALASDGEMKR